MRIGTSSTSIPMRALNIQVASLERLQAASNASSPTSVPVRGVDAAPGEAYLRRVPAHLLDIRV